MGGRTLRSVHEAVSWLFFSICWVCVLFFYLHPRLRGLCALLHLCFFCCQTVLCMRALNPFKAEHGFQLTLRQTGRCKLSRVSHAVVHKCLFRIRHRNQGCISRATHITDSTRPPVASCLAVILSIHMTSSPLHVSFTACDGCYVLRELWSNVSMLMFVLQLPSGTHDRTGDMHIGTYLSL